MMKTGIILLNVWLLRNLGFSDTELSKKYGFSQPSVSISVKRGARIAQSVKSATTTSWGYEGGPWKGPGPPLLVTADFLKRILDT